MSVEIIWNYTEFDAIHDLGALPLIPLHTYQPANRQYGEVLKVIMRVQVNGVRLFFEIEGTKLRLNENSFVDREDVGSVQSYQNCKRLNHLS